MTLFSSRVEMILPYYLVVFSFTFPIPSQSINYNHVLDDNYRFNVHSLQPIVFRPNRFLSYPWQLNHLPVNSKSAKGKQISLNIISISDNFSSSKRKCYNAIHRNHRKVATEKQIVVEKQQQTQIQHHCERYIKIILHEYLTVRVKKTTKLM